MGVISMGQLVPGGLEADEAFISTLCISLA